MISIFSKGELKATRDFLKKIHDMEMFKELDRFGEMGVSALAQATPVDTRLTATSWRYRVITDKGRPGIEWYNTNNAGGTPVAILIQYGHGTGTGGYVAGRDFINPAMRPVFDKIAADIWKKVMS